jgi:molybdopterin-guanine dinucleotide biosynthesis protein A
MGRDKALVELGGAALAVRVRDALVAAGATAVRAIGGDGPRLAALGLAVDADDDPGAGPLGGLLTALRTARAADVVLVVACDLVRPDPAALAATVAALERGAAADPAADVAVPLVGGRRQWLHAAYRTKALPALAAAYGSGERAVHRAVMALDVVEVTGVDPAAVADADTPADLEPPPGR